MSSSVEDIAETSPGPGSQTSLRSANELRVLEALFEGGEMTQADLARRTALAPSTVSNIVHELIRNSAATMSEAHGGRKGRKVRLTPRKGLLLGIDVGFHHLGVALATTSLEVLAETSVAQPYNHRPEDVIALARTLADRLLSETGNVMSDVRHVGLVRPTVLPVWSGVDDVALARRTFDRPVLLENDANAGALAEHTLGVGQGIDDLVYVKVASGIGAGLILDSRLYRGATGISGELGHITIDDRGKMCRCGNRGCLETIATTPRVLEMVAEARPQVRTLDDLIEGARAGDAVCVRALADTARAIGVAIANLCNIVNPHTVVIGGELASAGQLLVIPMMDIVRTYGVHAAVKDVHLVLAGLGERSQLMGALVVARGAIDPTDLLAQ